MVMPRHTAIPMTDHQISPQRHANMAAIHGKDTTPFLLARVAELTGGDSLESNIRLVLNNAMVAAKTAAALCASD